VFDPVPRVGARVPGLGSLDGSEHHVDFAVAIRMRGDLEACVVHGLDDRRRGGHVPIVKIVFDWLHMPDRVVRNILHPVQKRFIGQLLWKQGLGRLLSAELLP
jgi:hypothetical protein